MDTKEQEVREAVKFFCDNPNNMPLAKAGEYEHHFQTLLSLVQDYLGIEGWPEEIKQIHRGGVTAEKDGYNYVEGFNFALHLCKLALLKKISTENIDNAVFKVMLTKSEYRALPDYYVKQICREAIHDSICGKEKG